MNTNPISEPGREATHTIGSSRGVLESEEGHIISLHDVLQQMYWNRTLTIRHFIQVQKMAH